MLLDGHPHVVACPFAGFGMGFITEAFDRFIERKQNRTLVDRVQLENKHALNIRVRHKNLATVVRVSEIIDFALTTGGGFRNLIEASIRGSIRAGPHQGKQVFVPFDCSYLEVISNFQKGLTTMEEFDANTIRATLYRSFLNAWKNRAHRHQEPEYFLIVAPNRLRTIEACLKNDEQSTVIAMRRDPAGRAFWNARQIANKFDGYKGADQVKLLSIATNIFWIVMSPRLFSIEFLKEEKAYRTAISKLEEHYDNLVVVDFEILIESTREMMESIAAALGITTEPILFTASLNCCLIDNQELDITNKIHDDPRGILSLDQIGAIRLAAGSEVGPCTQLQKIRIKTIYWVNFLVYKIRFY